MQDKKDVIKDILFTVFFMGYMLLVLFILPKLFLLAGHGIESEINLTKFLFYSAPAAVVGIFLIILKWVRAYTKSPYIDSIIHDPETSILYNVPILNMILKNPKLLILGSILFFSGLIFINNLTQTAFFVAEVPRIEMQVTETADIGLHVFPAADAETIELGATLVFILIIFALLKKKYDIDDLTHKIAIHIFVPLIGMVLWLVYHLARYGASDIALLSVMGFGLISSLIIIYTKSLIPAIILHQLNNLYVRLFEMYSSDRVIIISSVIWGIILIIFIISLINELRKGQNA